MLDDSKSDSGPLLLEKHVVACLDDDPAVLASLRRALRNEPYEVQTLRAPEEALDLLRKRDVSLLLCDHRMPRMYGADLLEEVRKRHPRTVRVMLTAFPGSTLVSHGLANGIDWLISKPWNDEALRLTLRQLLSDSEAGRSPGRDFRKASPGPREEIAQRLGFFPPIWESAASSPPVLRSLWEQTRTGHLENPLPASFKERLFAYLSRFCRTSYSLVAGSCALHALGMPGPRILALLEEPPPAVDIDLAAQFAALQALPSPLEAWPGPGSDLDRSLFRCAVALFQNGSAAARCRAELRRALKPESFANLLAFLFQVREFHGWAEAHPDASPEADPKLAGRREALFREEPRLRDFFATHVDRVRLERRKVEDRLLDVILGLRKREGALQKMHEELETRIQERTSELSRVNGQLLQDIVERKRAEEERDRLGAQLLQGQKLQAIGQLSAGIAHEINNPVGFILSNLTTVQEYLADLSRLLRLALEVALPGSGNGGVPDRPQLEHLRGEIDADFILEDFRQALDETRQGAERIRDIVRSLKEFSHVDDGELKPTDLHECLENSLRICWNELKYRAEVRRSFDPMPPVLCYPLGLSQVFVNLLMNAVQAIAEKGEIEVAAKAERDEAVIRIRDTGSGIPEDVLPRIFDPFFTTKPVGKGTGLGLHVAYTIVHAHNGRIEVKSKVGEGTEFTVRLPLGGPASK